MYDGRMARLVACVLVTMACGSSQKGSTPTPKAVSASAPMLVSGDRCHDAVCTCRAVDDYNRSGLTQETDVIESAKRFEFRTGRGFDTVEVTVEKRGTLKKSREVADAACGYVDLPPGKHRIHLHAKAASEVNGMVPALFINEWSSRSHDWYDSFVFKCGDNGACTKDHLSLWAETEGKKGRGIFDPCGSVRIENLRWDGSYAPDVKVTELDMEFTMVVYKFVPRFPHGTKTCKGKGGVEAPEEPKDLPQ
jgi:hypothetical protein